MRFREQRAPAAPTDAAGARHDRRVTATVLAVLLSATLAVRGGATQAPASGAGAAAPARAPKPKPEPEPEPEPKKETGGPEMTLKQAVAYALKNNPRIAGAAAQVREARARVMQRQAERLPHFGSNTYIFRQGPVIPAFNPGQPPAFPPYRWNLGTFVSQVIFDWGQRAASHRAAQRDVDAARFRGAETENDVSLVVGVSYFNVLRARALVDVAQQRVRAADEQLRVSRARFAADVAPRFDVIRSEAEQADAQQALIEAQGDQALGEAAFNTALGREVTSPVRLAMPPPDEVPEVPYERLRGLALGRRPLLRSLEAAVRSGGDVVRSRQAEQKPQLNFSGTYDRPNPGGFASSDFRYSGGVVMSFPFFDSGLIRGRVHEAQAVAEGSRRELERARQQVELDVRQAQLDLIEARRRIETSRKEVASAGEALRVAELRYRSGVGTNVEVTDAQVAAARAGQNLANSQFDYLTAAVRLEYATGAKLSEIAARPPAVPAPALSPPAAPKPGPPAGLGAAGGGPTSR